MVQLFFIIMAMKFNVELAKERLNNAQVVFFDLDGTLIDTEPLYNKYWREASKYYGYELTKEEALNMRSRDVTSAIEYLNEVSGGKLDYFKVKAKRSELMDEYWKDHPIELKPGALDILKKLKEENKKIYIVTANTVEKSERIIKSVGFRDLIDDIISAKDVKRGKPFPDVFLYACEYVGLKPQDAIVFEDSPNGLMSSFRAGCFTIMIEDMTPYEEEMDYVNAAITTWVDIL